MEHAEATAAEQLSTFCAEIKWSRLPVIVRDRTKELVLDFLGVAARGSAERSSQQATSFVRETQPAGAATVIGGRFQSTAAWAALANGTAGHAIELDDVTTESSLHPAVTVIPAALALAEERDASPIAFLEAVVAGYEVALRVGNALNPASAYARGFHPTGVAGAFGAAMAVGLLRGLDPAGLARCLGIAGTLTTGSLEYLSDGSLTKRLNAGWAAHAGVVAAGLAQAGFTGPTSVFEGRLGTLHAYSDAPFPDRLLVDLGEPLQITRVSIKPYACCRYNHGLVDCVLALRREHQFSLEEVDRIRLGVLRGGAVLVADPIERKRAPANVVEAQFSAPYAAAVALVRGSAGVADYTEENIADPTIQRLMARTDCFHDPSLDAEYPARWPAIAEIRLANGATFSRRIEFATGEPENPVSREGLVAKFSALAGGIIPDPDDVGRLAGRILALDDEPGLPGLMARFAAEPTHAPATARSPRGGHRDRGS